MTAILFLLQLFGASFLLLFAVKTVRKGVEASFAGELRMLLQETNGAAQSAFSGFLLAIMLQGATAVILLTSGMVSAGLVGLSAGLAVAIGADVGSAVVVRLLTFNIEWLTPLLLLLGGWLYLRIEHNRLKDMGRALIGIALILVSLTMISEAVSPIRQSDLLPAVSKYLGNDLILAFLVGVIFTLLIHSSVASILVCVTLVSSDALPFDAGMAFILGANVGSALIPVWLLRSSERSEKLLPLLNLGVRTLAAVLAMILLMSAGDTFPDIPWVEGAGGIILIHLGFNVSLLPVLFASDWLANNFERLFTGPVPTAEADGLLMRIGENQQEDIDVRAAMRRDVIALLDLVSAMISKIGFPLEQLEEVDAKSIEELEGQTNTQFNSIRTYYARISSSATINTKKSHLQEMRALLEYAIRLEHSGNVMVQRILPAAQMMRRTRLQFTSNGNEELKGLCEMALSNTFLAFEVVSTWQAEKSRDLIERKEEFSRLDSRSRKRHFKRISQGNATSLETSDLHLDVGAALKEINSKISTIAYSVLEGKGQLAASRLIDES